MSAAYRPPLAPAVARALARWPDVPAAYGWLHLDRRGRWSVPDGRITHPGTTAFLQSHYGADEAGRWYVQNGPQRAYVTLDLAPWVFSLDGTGQLVAFNGVRVRTPSLLVVADDGDLLLMTEIGLGNVLDRDVASFLDHLGTGRTNCSLDEVLAGKADAKLRFEESEIAVVHLPEEALPARFGFQRLPRPDS